MHPGTHPPLRLAPLDLPVAMNEAVPKGAAGFSKDTRTQ